ncbi:SAG family member [Eimeria mitis]|uniref:SAG family member n=1 Tax=Eimeria mitis TaxID=44415 RepID=U6JWX0_9EIME|nr:SAG family member [Eimeria mitis]CDJ28552.1 SAG family member [Eimeria mitis]
MAPLKLLTVVSSSLLLLAKANGGPTADQTTYNVALGEEGKCLAEVNAARVAAGFSELAQAAEPTSRLPKGGDFPQVDQPKWAWEPVCEALIPTKTKSKRTADANDKAEFQSGTYAYLPIDDANSVDCKAVVDKWKDAYSNFDGLGDQPKWAWKPVCEALIPTTEKSRSTRNSEDAADFQSGTYAYLPIDDPNSVDCKAVVDKWKDAYSNFDGLPPAKKGEDNLYDNQENVSFVALYNPTDKATADCRVVTCTKKTSAAQASRGTDGAGQSTETEASALICMTAPDVLADEQKAPFTDEQWEQIVTALEGSASAVAPGVVGFALAIVGLSML